MREWIHRRGATVRRAVAVALAAAAAPACASMTSASFLAGETDPTSATPPPRASGDGAGATLGADSDGVILVHASPNLPPFRVCFGNRPDLVPEPRTKVMPQSNVVGVEVGTAVHVGAMHARINSPVTDAAPPPVFDAGPSDGATFEGGRPEAGTALDAQRIYLFDEARLRNLKDVLCRDLLKYPLVEGKDYWQVTWNAGGVFLQPAVYLLSVEGCHAETGPPKLDTRVCGAGFTAATGNLRVTTFTLTPVQTRPDKLAAQVLVLSDAVRDAIGKAKSKVEFGELANKLQAFSAEPSRTQITPPQPQEFSFPGTVDSYGTHGFALTVGAAKPFTQTLAETQRLTAPLSLPQAFYRLPSNFVLLVLGDDTLAGRKDVDPGLALHFLTIPVRDPDSLGDAGTDAER